MSLGCGVGAPTKVGAGLLICCEGACLLLRRSETSGNPGTWGLPGGNADPEDAGQLLNTAMRESREELGELPPGMSVLGSVLTRQDIISRIASSNLGCVRNYLGGLRYPDYGIRALEASPGTHLLSFILCRFFRSSSSFFRAVFSVRSPGTAPDCPPEPHHGQYNQHKQLTLPRPLQLNAVKTPAS
ncbi:hypothetical protein Vafri_19373 [Volvox africanus]|uniref:Nudix hydrolase domain-containing protein n=1 Tax=Volvox africanus TaxID=51714 RepID=A0A8J4F8K5_9CHLO|nr:hypothetical protein Vafri_19373 [Volvox africanus]